MTNWPDDVVATLRETWAAGMSAAACAGELWDKHRVAVTRSAVLGKVNRLGLGRPISKPAAPRRRRAAGSSILAPHERTSGVTALKSPKYSDDAEARDLPPDQSEFACTLMELRECSCRWPLGHPGSPDFRFCGADKGGNLGPYCRRHTRIATGKPLKIRDEERERRVRQAQQNYIKHGSREAPSTFVSIGDAAARVVGNLQRK